MQTEKEWKNRPISVLSAKLGLLALAQISNGLLK